MGRVRAPAGRPERRTRAHRGARRPPPPPRLRRPARAPRPGAVRRCRQRMTVLAVDTASRQRALCVLAAADGTLLDHRALAGRDLDRALPAALAALLRDDVAAVACVMGPGSYTGLRVGIAAALGVAHARGLPRYAVAALGVVAPAAPVSAADVEAVAAAGRGALYVARYPRDGAALPPPDPPRPVD